MTILPNKRNPNSNKEVEKNEQNNNTTNHTTQSRRGILSSSQILIQDSTQNRISPVGSPHVSHLLGNAFAEEQSTSNSGSGRQCRTYSRERASKRKTRDHLEHASASKTNVPPNISYKQNDDNEGEGGYNSEDEYEPIRFAKISNEEWESRDRAFKELMRKKGLVVKNIVEDGACLFRAIADQVYGNEDMHSVVRNHCMDYIIQNRDFFSEYITEDINRYVNRKRNDFVHGNHLEIQALSEMYNRTIEVYCYSEEPINIFHGTSKYDYEPMRLSYQRGSHYNSIVNPYSATIGVGLGLPNYQPGEADRKLLTDATTASELTLIEQTMIQDKIAATDWEATNDAILEQATRESWALYVNDGNLRDPVAGCSTSGMASSSSSSPRSPRTTAHNAHNLASSSLSGQRLANAAAHRSPSQRERFAAARVPTPPGRIPSPPSASLRLTPDRRIPTPPAANILRIPPGHRISTPPHNSRACISLPSSPSSRVPSNMAVATTTRMHSMPNSPHGSPRLSNANHSTRTRIDISATVSSPSNEETLNEQPDNFNSDSLNDNKNDRETNFKSWEDCDNFYNAERQSSDNKDENFFMRMPPEMFGMTGWGDDADIVAKVLAESQEEYLNSLKAARQPQSNTNPNSSPVDSIDVNAPGPSHEFRFVPIVQLWRCTDTKTDKEQENIDQEPRVSEELLQPRPRGDKTVHRHAETSVDISVCYENGYADCWMGLDVPTERTS